MNLQVRLAVEACIPPRGNQRGDLAGFGVFREIKVEGSIRYCFCVFGASGVDYLQLLVVASLRLCRPRFSTAMKPTRAQQKPAP